VIPFWWDNKTESLIATVLKEVPHLAQNKLLFLNNNGQPIAEFL